MGANEEKAIDRSKRRDARVREAVGLLEAGVSEILTSERFKDYLRFLAAFHRYSPNNSLLIFMQRPDATRVAGYKRWRELGRQVRRGEEGIRILAPILKKVPGDEMDERVPGSAAGASGRAPTQALIGFKTVKVFALEQTDHVPGAPPLPTPPELGSVGSGPEAHVVAARLEAGLRSLLEREDVPVSEEEMEGRDGYYNRSEKRIALRAGLSEVERATTLCHEAVHHLLHEKGATPTTRATRETEAEGTSYAVFSYFGLDTGEFSFAYVANFVADTEVLKTALSRIRGVAHRIIETVEALPTSESGAAA
jgi:hypothetical protein